MRSQLFALLILAENHKGLALCSFQLPVCIYCSFCENVLSVILRALVAFARLRTDRPQCHLRCGSLRALAHLPIGRGQTALLPRNLDVCLLNASFYRLKRLERSRLLFRKRVETLLTMKFADCQTTLSELVVVLLHLLGEELVTARCAVSG